MGQVTPGTRRTGLTSRQAEMLNELLEETPFLAAVRKLGLSKQHGAELLEYLRRHGLITTGPRDTYRVRNVPAKPHQRQKVIWWFTEEGRWELAFVPVGRYRSDTETQSFVVVVQPPAGLAVHLVVSNRRRVSYRLVGRELQRAGVAVSEPLLRRLTESIAQVVGTEAVLEPWFSIE